MNKEEFITKKLAIDIDHRKKISVLSREYAFSNSPVKVGDIIKNHCEIIQVETIRYTIPDYVNTVPTCTYSGPKLTKKLVPFKSKEKSRMWQPDVEEINRKPYNFKESEK